MSEPAAGHILGKVLVEKQELETLIAQYRDSHYDIGSQRNGTDRCECWLCNRAEGLGIPPISWLLDAEDAVAELGRLA